MSDLIQDIDQFIEELQSPPVMPITDDIKQSVLNLTNRYLTSYYLPARQFVKDFLVDILENSGELNLGDELKSDVARYVQVQIKPGTALVKVDGKDVCKCTTFEELKACLVEMLKPVPNEYLRFSDTVLPTIIKKIVNDLKVDADIVRQILSENV